MNQRAIVGFINVFIIVVIIIYFSKEFFTYKGKDTIICIKKGMGRTQIAQLLEEKRIVPSATLFLIYTEAMGKNLKYGCYRIKHGYTIYDVWKTLHEGREILFKFTIVPGDNLITIGEKLEKLGFIKSRFDFYKYVFNDQNVRKHGLKGITFEGYFPPETYKFSKIKTNESVEYIVEAFLKEFNRKYKPYENILNRRFKKVVIKQVCPPEEDIDTNENKKINKNNDIKLCLDFYDMMIIASMVEKETALPEEKPLIAGVIIERLQRGIILQIDPTTIYALQLQRLILKNPDIFKNFAIYKRYREYDTYRYSGLPPTPICSFSIDTLEATLNPINRENFLFYFTPDGKKHIFSKTLEEHRRNIRKYRYKGKN